MSRLVWKDRIVERPRTFNKIENPDGTITLEPAPGQVIQEGTPVNAENLNLLGKVIDDATGDRYVWGIEDGLVYLEKEGI